MIPCALYLVCSVSDPRATTRVRHSVGRSRWSGPVSEANRVPSVSGVRSHGRCKASGREENSGGKVDEVSPQRLLQGAGGEAIGWATGRQHDAVGGRHRGAVAQPRRGRRGSRRSTPIRPARRPGPPRRRNASCSSSASWGARSARRPTRMYSPPDHHHHAAADERQTRSWLSRYADRCVVQRPLRPIAMPASLRQRLLDQDVPVDRRDCHRPLQDPSANR
jgi:hypothetical protein